MGRRVREREVDTKQRAIQEQCHKKIREREGFHKHLLVRYIHNMKVNVNTHTEDQSLE